MRRDPYEVLRLPRGASVEQIRSAYRQLARQYHPDCSGCPETAEAFRGITEAYNQLSNPQAAAGDGQPRRAQSSIRIRVRPGSSEQPPVASKGPVHGPGVGRARVVPEPLIPPGRQRPAAAPRPIPSELSLLLWLLSDDYFLR